MAKGKKQTESAIGVEQSTPAVTPNPEEQDNIAHGKLVKTEDGKLVVVATDIPKKNRVKDTPGRPIDPNSERQQRLAELEEKRQKGVLKRGRPVMEGSERQQRLFQREEKAKAGIPIKPGRPRYVKIMINGKEVVMQEGSVLEPVDNSATT